MSHFTSIKVRKTHWLLYTCIGERDRIAQKGGDVTEENKELREEGQRQTETPVAEEVSSWRQVSSSVTTIITKQTHTQI